MVSDTVDLAVCTVSLLTALLRKVINFVNFDLDLCMCMCVGRDHCLADVENQGQRSTVRVSMNGNVVGPRSLIDGSF